MPSQIKLGSVVRIAGFAGMTANSDTPSVLKAEVAPMSGFLELTAKAQGHAAITLLNGQTFNVVFKVEVTPV